MLTWKTFLAIAVVATIAIPCLAQKSFASAFGASNPSSGQNQASAKVSASNLADSAGKPSAVDSLKEKKRSPRQQQRALKENYAKKFSALAQN